MDLDSLDRGIKEEGGREVKATVIEFYESKRRLLLLLGGCLLFVVAGFYFTYTLFKEDRFLYAFIMLLCGGFFLFILKLNVEKLTTGHPHVVITPEYLQLYMLPTENIPIRWDDIETFIPYRMHSNSFIGIELKDEGKYAKLMPNKVKKLSRMNVRMGYPQYNIVLSHLKEKHLLIEELEKRIPSPNEMNVRTDEALK
jgi:hypothetical protein